GSARDLVGLVGQLLVVRRTAGHAGAGYGARGGCDAWVVLGFCRRFKIRGTLPAGLREADRVPGFPGRPEGLNLREVLLQRGGVGSDRVVVLRRDVAAERAARGP